MLRERDVELRERKPGAHSLVPKHTQASMHHHNAMMAPRVAVVNAYDYGFSRKQFRADALSNMLAAGLAAR